MRVAVFNFCFSKYQTPRKFTWNLYYDVDNTLDVTPAKFEKSKFRNGWEIWIWSAEDRIGIIKLEAQVSLYRSPDINKFS